HGLAGRGRPWRNVEGRAADRRAAGRAALARGRRARGRAGRRGGLGRLASATPVGRRNRLLAVGSAPSLTGSRRAQCRGSGGAGGGLTRVVTSKEQKAGN